MFDTHLHVACADQQRFPRRGSGRAAAWADDERGSPGSVLGEVWAAGVERAVIVQAVGVYGEDARCAAHAVAADRARLSLVTAVQVGPDGRVSDLVHVVSNLPATPVGVRLFAIDASDQWFATSAGRDTLAECARRGLVAVCTVLPRHVAALGEAIGALPDVRVVIDHAGFPEMADAGVDGHVLVGTLAAADNVWVKVTTHNLARSTGPRPPGEWLTELHDRFDGRLIWGSDHPQHDGSYASKLALLKRATSGWSAEQVTRLTNTNAAALFAVP